MDTAAAARTLNRQTQRVMDHRCTIERDAASGTGTWNQKPSPSWAPHLEDVRCRVWSTTTEEPVDDTKTVALEDRRLILDKGLDVVEGDRVALVWAAGDDPEDSGFEPVFDGPVNIEGVIAYHTHTELMLERIH